MDVYPTIIPLSKEFGSVRVKTSMWGGDECKVKIYPCLVHVLFRGQLHKYDAEAMPGLIKQMTAAQDLIKEVTTTRAQKDSE